MFEDPPRHKTNTNTISGIFEVYDTVTVLLESGTMMSRNYYRPYRRLQIVGTGMQDDLCWLSFCRWFGVDGHVPTFWLLRRMFRAGRSRSLHQPGRAVRPQPSLFPSLGSYLNLALESY